MLEIIILIIIITVLFNKTKKSGKKNDTNSNSTTYSYGSQTVVSTKSNQSYGNQAGSRTSYSNQTKRTNTKATGTNVEVANSQKSNDKKVSEKAESTLDYLNKKAAEDRAEHLAEKRQAAMKQKQIYGNAKVGERLLLGDAVPRGMIQVNCSYCGAENLMQPRDRGNCICYFCKTKL